MQSPTKHTDARGFFQELYHFNSDFTPCQASWLSIEPGQIRGGHFHELTSEIFIVLEGSVRFISIKDKTTTIYTINAGGSARTCPYEDHAFYSKDGCKILAFANRHFNPNDPDCFYTSESLSAAKRLIDHI